MLNNNVQVILSPVEVDRIIEDMRDLARQCGDAPLTEPCPCSTCELRYAIADKLATEARLAEAERAKREARRKSRSKRPPSVQPGGTGNKFVTGR